MDERWVFDQHTLRTMALQYYKEMFKTEMTDTCHIRTRFQFPNLNAADLNLLHADVSKEDIRAAVFDLGAFKAPGPDGIQAVLYQEYWNLVEDSICNLVKTFFDEPQKVKKINNTNIVLIPKGDNPESIKDFRPISLCNVSYKIITKVISRRLRTVMEKIIGDHQCSFIAGRQSSDNIIIAQEVIHSMRKKTGKKGWMAVKVDLEKAYDRLEWNFIQDTLAAVGFDEKWCSAIMACITTPSFQILWNGEATETFASSRGIRQGDPISPYIFTLCMERLNHIIKDAIEDGFWKPIHLKKEGPAISHLFFADDLILFGDASESQVEGMIDCLQSFCRASGQLMNKNKTKVCFSKNVHGSRALHLSQMMGVGLTGDLGKYLGIPLIHKRVSNVVFTPILEKTKKKLAAWKRGCLSFAGRTTLIKAVLTALPSYFMQTMLLPKGLVKDLEKKSRDFLWGDDVQGRKIHLISWEHIKKDKRDGGLGIKDLRKQNQAFVMKLCWNLLINKEALWVRVLRNKYNCGDGFKPKIRKKEGVSYTWRGITSIWNKFDKGVGVKIGNGESASFWFDNWSELNRPLIDLIPGYEDFVEENDKVAYYVDPQGEWDRNKLSRWFQNSVVDRIMCAHPPCAARGEDKYYWRPGSDGRFSVNSAYHFLFAGTHRDEEHIWKSLWKWAVPEKIKSFMWMFAHGRVHTAKLRAQRGLEDTARCPFGCDQEEDLMHLIRDCRNARERWISIINPVLWERFSTLQGMEWLRWNLKQKAGRDFTKKVQWASLFGYVCWDIWVTRCRKLFGEEADIESTNAYNSFFRANWDNDLVSNCHFYNNLNDASSVIREHRTGFFYLEVDASVLESRRSGCGGAIRGEDGSWICGFARKLISVPPTVAEIIAIIQGLQLCWGRGYKKVIVSTDCVEAVNVITRGCDQNHPFKDIIDDARLWMCKDWQVLIKYIPREENSLADHLAKLAHTIVETFIMFDQPPPTYQEVVR